MWKTLLVPYDFSDTASRALDVATHIADTATIILFHVCPLPADLPGSTVVHSTGQAEGTVDDVVVAAAKKELDAIAAPLRAEGYDVRTEAVPSHRGRIATQLLEAAAKHGADALVLGTHGRTGLARVVMGSVADGVVRTADLPIVMVRGVAGASTPRPG